MQVIDTPGELSSFYARIQARNSGQWFDFEPIIQSVYEALLNPGDSVIDGGAHRGLHTIPMARKVAPTGTVAAFEPIHKLAWLLQARIRIEAPELLPVIRVVEVALSKFQGTADFLVAGNPAYSGLQPRLYPLPDMATRKVRVEVDTLDHQCTAIDRLRFIKLDLEGGEFDAILGGRSLIEKHRPVLVFEYDCHRSPGFYGFRHQDLLDLFANLGYNIVDVLGVPFTNPDLWTAASVWYYFAIPREQGLEPVILTAIKRCTNTVTE